MALNVIANNFSVISSLFASFLALLVYFLFNWFWRKTPKNLPPGPRGWKNTLKFLKATRSHSVHELAVEWAKEYGPITFFYNFGQPLAILNSAEISRRLLSADEYKQILADREQTFASKLAWYNGKDIFFTKYGAITRKKRRMFYNIIHLYGDGVEKFETVVSEEMDRFMNEIGNHEGEDIDFSNFLGRSLKCILYILAIGERPADISIPNILEEYDIALNKLWSTNNEFVLTYIPILSKFPGRYKKVVDTFLKKKARAEELMYHTPRRTHIPGKPRGLSGLLFEESKKPGNEWMDQDPQHMIAYLTSLFLAAHLTSRATLLGIFLCLLNYPKCVKKIQDEIDRVLGDRRPKVEDRSIMPYSEACILEILRLVSQIPLSGFRTSNADVHVDGMTIPKGTLFLMNQWYFLHDEKIWEDPWSFKPERFLDSKGHILPADNPVRKNTLPFGIGLRSCPGEVFARSRVFLFVTNVLQKFDLFPPANEKLVAADFTVNDDSVKGLIRQVQPYKCRLQRRPALQEE